MKTIQRATLICSVLYSADAFSVGPLHTSARANSHAPSKVSTPRPNRATALPALAIEAAQEGSWKAYLDDEKTGLIFYYNHKTGESRWEPPSSSFPAVQLNSFLQEQTSAVREAYLNTLKKDRVNPLKQLENILGPKLGSLSDASKASVEVNAKDIQKDVPTSFKVAKEAEKASDPSMVLQETMGSIMSKFPGKEKKPEVSEPPKKSEPPSPKNEDKFTFAQKIESTKAAVAGFVTGATVQIPFSAFSTLAGDSINKGAQFGVDTAIGGVEAALFGIVYRYCVREGEETNEQLGNGAAGAFAITRALSAVSGDLDQLDLGLVSKLAFNGLESLVLFYAVKAALDLLADKGIVGRMK